MLTPAALLAPTETGDPAGASTVGLRLGEAFNRLGEREQAAVVDHDLLQGAIADAVGRLCGITVHTIAYSTFRIASFALPQGRFVHGVDGPYEQRQWADTVDDAGRTLTQRAYRLTGALDRLRLNPNTVDDTVSAQCPPSQTDMVRFHAALPLWWHARLREGHSAESARMMLGLIVDSDTWPHLVFTGPDGLPGPGRTFRHPFV